MNDRDTEKMLRQLGKKIQINQEHKMELRKSFSTQKKARNHYIRYIAVACISIFALAAAFSVWFTPINKVQADSLKVQNYMTYLEVESSYDFSIAEYNGDLYIPNVQEGIYKYSGEKQVKIYTGNVSLVKVSPEGGKLVFVQEGDIGVLDLKTLQSKILLQSDNKTAYESPAWFDEESILFTKLTIQEPSSSYYDFNSGEIIKLRLENLTQTKVADGINASYIPVTDSLLYQRGENIIIKGLKSNTEKIIDKGEQPIASRDGKAIAYAKLHIENERIAENVMIEKVLQNLWVAEGKNYEQKTMITNNIVLEDINKEEWLKNLKPSEELQILSLSGRFSYQFPTWSSDSRTIYALRRDYADRTAVVVKIELGRESLSAEMIVERFMQSIILQDEDYQRSLQAVEMKVVEDLKDKKILAYQIMGRGQENSEVFVDVEIRYDGVKEAASKPFRIRFYVSNETGQKYIMNMMELK